MLDIDDRVRVRVIARVIYSYCFYALSSGCLGGCRYTRYRVFWSKISCLLMLRYSVRYRIYVINMVRFVSRSAVRGIEVSYGFESIKKQSKIS